MKFRRKKRSLFKLFLIIGIGLAFCLVFIQKKEGKIQATDQSNRSYTINITAKEDSDSVSIQIEETEPEIEMILSYEGMEELDNKVLQESADFEGKISVNDGNEENQKIIIIKNEKKEPVKMNFAIQRKGDAEVGRVVLQDTSRNTLVTKEFSFEPIAEEEMIETVAEPVEIEKQQIDSLSTREQTNIEVRTWEEFRLAWNDQTVTKIKLTNDITRNNTATVDPRTEDIEIDGSKPVSNTTGEKYFRLDSTGIGFMLGEVSSGTATLHVHDIILRNNGNTANPTSINNTAAMFGDRYYEPKDSQVATNKWNLRFGNIIVPKESSGGTARLARAPRGLVTVYGDMEVYTRSENFYLGGLIVEDGTNYYGDLYQSNYSIIWFRQPSFESDTGTNKVTIGKNATLKLRNTRGSANYPAIYRFFKEIEVGENSNFILTVPGTALAFGGENQKFTAKKGSTVILTSVGSGNANVSVSTVLEQTLGGGTLTGGFADSGIGKNLLFTVEPGASFYSIGSSTSGMISTSGTSSTGNQFIFDNPAAYDIRNNGRYPALNIGGTGNSFTIVDSQIGLWKYGTTNATSNFTALPDFMDEAVENFTVTSRTEATSINSSLGADFTGAKGNIRRIQGINTAPILEEITPITTADKNITKFLRVKIGDVPDDNGIAEDGSMNTVPVYATQGQVTATIDYNGETKQVSTNDEGYLNYQIDEFYDPSLPLKIKLNRSGVESEWQTLSVINVTPPEPAKLSAGKITNATKQLSGVEATPNSKIYVDINGERESVVGRVNADGTWHYNLPRYLTVDDTVQIFLEDHDGKIEVDLNPVAPSTNSEDGNINPEKDLNYRDAVFKAAPLYTVEDGIPKAELSSKVSSSSGETTQVGDTLTYTWVVKNDKPDSLDAEWSKVVFTNKLPEGLEFTPNDGGILLNGETLATTDYTYDAETRELTITLGAIKAGESLTIEYSTIVEQEAVGTEITNKAIASGYSSLEDGEFVPGAVDPEKMTIVKAESSIKNPGGSIFGTLELVSAPKVINFGTVKFQPSGTNINNPTYEGDDLKVKDGRAIQENWTLYAHLEKELTNTADSTKVLTNAIRYVSNGEEYVLSGSSDAILSRTNETSEPFNISSTWSPTGDGFKLKVDSGKSIAEGKYQATIVWQLLASPAPESESP